MLETLRDAVLRGDAEASAELTSEGLGSGLEPEQILNDTLIPTMGIVGEEFERGERFIPEMLVSAVAMKASMAILRPLLAEKGVEPKGKVVIGTVRGDLHDIGKDLVATMLEGAGYEIVDLGVEVTPEAFVDAVREHAPQVVAMSALLTTTMAHMPQVIAALTDAGLRDSVKIVIGGAPVTQEYAEEIAADGYADDAASAVYLVEKLLSEQSPSGRESLVA